MELIQKTLKYKGKEEQVYFKELTAGQRLSLLKGQRIQTHPGDEKATIEIDLGDNLERNHRLVQMTLVTAEGVLVYRTIGELQSESDAKVRALVKLASEVHKDDDEEKNA